MASGMISKVFPSHKPSHGFIRVLTPLKLRGEQLDFSYADVNLTTEDKQYLSVGMIMDITIKSSKATRVSWQNV